MAQLTQDDIKKLADLAKIEITINEAENYMKDINNILGHLAMVAEAPTENVSTNFRFLNNLREDNLDTRDFSKDIIFQNIPAKSADNYVKVSKVINKSK